MQITFKQFMDIFYIATAGIVSINLFLMVITILVYRCHRAIKKNNKKRCSCGGNTAHSSQQKYNTKQILND